MLNRHDNLDLPSQLVTEASGDQLRVAMPGGPSAVFRHLWVPTLTLRTVDEIVGDGDPGSKQPVFVSYQRGSAEARKAMRDAGISFAGDDGRTFIQAPGMLIDRDTPLRPRLTDRWGVETEQHASARNPFAKRSSRVARWLLLHHQEPISVAEIAQAVDLNPAAVSRVVRALEDAAFVREVDPDAAGRRREVRLQRPRALLDAWLPLWERRRVRQRLWDIGAVDADEALARLAEAATHVGTRRWAIGGVVGAATVRRAVEPSDVLVWIDEDSVEAFANALQPEPGRGGRGLVRLAAAPDPWTLGLAGQVDAIPVADPVQLWLDCASEGERALEAADAVAKAAGWS
jgi:DNA-binding MarR family transcriptional regulator